MLRHIGERRGAGQHAFGSVSTTAQLLLFIVSPLLLFSLTAIGFFGLRYPPWVYVVWFASIDEDIHCVLSIRRPVRQLRCGWNGLLHIREVLLRDDAKVVDAAEGLLHTLVASDGVLPRLRAHFGPPGTPQSNLLCMVTDIHARSDLSAHPGSLLPHRRPRLVMVIFHVVVMVSTNINFLHGPLPSYLHRCGDPLRRDATWHPSVPEVGEGALGTLFDDIYD